MTMTDYGHNQDNAKIVWLTKLPDPIAEYTPLATPVVLEVRKDQAFGGVNDGQIGQPSHIASVTLGGMKARKCDDQSSLCRSDPNISQSCEWPAATDSRERAEARRTNVQ